MCGRFSQFSDKIQEKFKAKIKDNILLDFKYNYSPSDKIKAVVTNSERWIVLFRWGIINDWSLRKNFHLFNIRSESLFDKKPFFKLFERQRCLVIADGFYEWKHEESTKKPYYIFMKNQEPFAFGGIYENWISPDGKIISSCAIITTKANKLINQIHERMPVIIPEDFWEIWLDNSRFERECMIKLLEPYPADGMEMYEVSKEINSTKTDGSFLIKSVSRN